MRDGFWLEVELLYFLSKWSTYHVLVTSASYTGFHAVTFNPAWISLVTSLVTGGWVRLLSDRSTRDNASRQVPLSVFHIYIFNATWRPCKPFGQGCVRADVISSPLPIILLSWDLGPLLPLSLRGLVTSYSLVNYVWSFSTNKMLFLWPLHEKHWI